ncbi:AraC-like ligand-binding domain-containing protein [Saccharopolyspora rosea]|uniref:Helix-turn-helix domain-containing protein n=2 Tax=Saccharopolyspora rosea TaxID=524884 RepID=A0ABW3FX50_9PSEU|nr:helix-turn-helix domain-containing protein [Saccharopolyspora rosea]
MPGTGAAPRAGHSFDSWEQAVSGTFVPLQASSPQRERFRGSIRAREVGAVHLAEVSASPHRVRRTSKLIRGTDSGQLKLSLQLRGHGLVCQDGRETLLGPGDFALYDTSHPYVLSFDEDFRVVVLMFPREFLRLRADDLAELRARRFCGREGTGLLVRSLLQDLCERDEAGTRSGVLIADALLDVLAAAVVETTGQYAARHRDLLGELRSFIERHLDDPELGPETIAARNHISVRYLHKLFSADGTPVSGWIRLRRLERCRRDLADPELAELPVSAIAGRWGLPNAAHFSRLFKAAFGVSPREYRTSRLG